MSSLYARLLQWAAVQPEAPCVIEAETGRTLTYSECVSAVQATCRLLGARPATLFLALPAGMANAVVWLSALAGGHTLVPLAANASAREWAALITRFAPDVVFADADPPLAAEHVAQLRLPVMSRARCEELTARAQSQSAKGPPALLGPVGEGHVCLMTSGSTGEPKPVVLTERQLDWTAGQVAHSHALTPADRGLTVLPFSHVNAPVVSLCASILSGSTVIIAQRFSLRRFWPWIEQHRVTWASIVPTIVALLLQVERPVFLPGALRFVRTASAPLPPIHLRQFELRFGVPVIETYGLTEAASQVCANPAPPGRRKPGSVGVPYGVSMRICHPQRSGATSATQDVFPGTVGEICIAGPSVIAGYGSAGARPGHYGWLRTGDLGYQDADGYIYLTGRLRDVINRGGENIAPREIEEVLLAHASVRDAAAIGRPDPVYGEQVVAYIVANESRTAELDERLRAHCAKHLSSHKVPVSFIVVEQLPRGATGKLDRPQLRTGLVSQEPRHEDGCVA
jgi:acyl-CoA synthetase (AMP-forming)/AMP-acid ligase II